MPQRSLDFQLVVSQIVTSKVRFPPAPPSNSLEENDYILQKSKSKEDAHIKASMIFTSNDVIINLGVIVAGLLVNWLSSSKPDLIIGAIVFMLVIQGAFRILKLSK